MTWTEESINFAALPEEGPIITGRTGRHRYQVSDVVRFNCTSAKSKPAAMLSWFINGEQVSFYHSLYMYMYITISGLHIYLHIYVRSSIYNVGVCVCVWAFAHRGNSNLINLRGLGSGREKGSESSLRSRDRLWPLGETPSIIIRARSIRAISPSDPPYSVPRERERKRAAARTSDYYYYHYAPFFSCRRRRRRRTSRN